MNTEIEQARVGRPLGIPQRQLWQCSNARVNGIDEEIYCKEGHPLTGKSLDGAIGLLKAQRGAPLCMRSCQDCIDYDEMGTPLEKKDRGWFTYRSGRTGVVASNGKRHIR